MFSIDVVSAFASITAGLDTLAQAELGGLDVADLLELAALTETSMRRHSVLSHDVSFQLHQRSVADLGGAAGKVLADWLRVSPAEARRRARVTAPLSRRTTLTGEVLAPRQPATAAAWRAGVLDGEHVRVIQRFLADLPVAVSAAAREEAEAFLAHHARLLRPDQLARLAQRLALELNPDGVFSDADRAARRSLLMGRQQPDGMTDVRLSATPELRAYLEALLAKYAAPGMCNPADQTALTDGEPAAAQIEADTRTVGQRQHDALMGVLRATLGDPKLGQHHGLPVTAIISATLQDLHDHTGYGLSAGGTLVPMKDVVRMTTHAQLFLSLFDGTTGQALWLGRTKRLASPDQRIVLHAKDRGCTAPGCTVPGYGCQVHHAAKDWSDGGATDIDELTFACKHHNLLVENHGWTTRKRKDGTTEWIPPPHLPLPGGTNTFHHPEQFLNNPEGDAHGEP